MDRITEQQLQGLVNYLNRITNSPTEPSHRDAAGRYVANVGHYTLEGAYGGWQLARICTDGGGITQPLGGGFHTKREMYDRLTAFIRGIETGVK